MKRLIIPIAIIALALIPASAQASHHLSVAKAKQVTEKVAYRWAMDDEYATRYFVGHCFRRSPQTFDCDAYIYSSVTKIECGETVRVHVNRYGYTSWSLPYPADSYCYDTRDD